MSGRLASAQCILKRVTPAHYGYGYYLQKGAVAPGMSLMAPRHCFQSGHGDCDALAVYLNDQVENDGKVWLVRIPYRDVKGKKSFIQHTISTIEEAGKRYLVGGTPYDQLINGKTGIFEEREYGIPFYSQSDLIRTKIESEMHRSLFFHDRLVGGVVGLIGNSLQVIEGNPYTMENPFAEGIPTVMVHILKMICAKDQLCPIQWDSPSQCFIEMAILLGIRPGEELVGYRVSIYRDVFDRSARAIITTASVTYFFVIPLNHLKLVQERISRWDPSQTLVNLRDWEEKPAGMEIRVESEENLSALRDDLAKLGASLFHAISNTFSPQKSKMDGLAVIKHLQGKPFSVGRIFG